MQLTYILLYINLRFIAARRARVIQMYYKVILQSFMRIKLGEKIAYIHKATAIFIINFYPKLLQYWP